MCTAQDVWEHAYVSAGAAGWRTPAPRVLVSPLMQCTASPPPPCASPLAALQYLQYKNVRPDYLKEASGRPVSCACPAAARCRAARQGCCCCRQRCR